MAFEKSVLSIVAYGLLSHLRYLYRFHRSRAARTWSFCNEMYHNLFWYEFLTFQTQIYLHKQYIFDTNIIQCEYALLFPFSIYTCNKLTSCMIPVPVKHDIPMEVVDSPAGCDTLRLLVHGPNLSRSKSAKTKVTETALGVTTS